MQSVPPLPEAVISLWLDSAFNRAPIEQVLKAHASSFAGYVVSESCPLDEPAPEAWFTQIAFLKRPENLSRAQWLHRWQEEHTKVAIETQSTHYYAQNIISRGLTPGAAEWDAIIEERFPLKALTDEHVFYAAANDAQLADHKRRMMESCSRFIDFRKINVVLTSIFA